MRSTAVLYSGQFSRHDNRQHPENQGRLDEVLRYLASQGQLDDRPVIGFNTAPIESVTDVHDKAYVSFLQEACDRGGGWMDQDTYLGPDSFDVALLGAGAVIAAVDAVIAGEALSAMVLARPPGHHATPASGMGFCLLNHVAIGATHAGSHGLERVAIIDWDVHHGNGTQDAFYRNGSVLYASIHRHPFYPGTGFADFRGEGEGLGSTLNVPLAGGTGESVWLEAFERKIVPAVAAFDPQLILVSAGFDAHIDDPLGGMRVTESGYDQMIQQVCGLAERSACGRLVLVLEGGYAPAALARSVSAVLAVLDDEAK